MTAKERKVKVLNLLTAFHGGRKNISRKAAASVRFFNSVAVMIEYYDRRHCDTKHHSFSMRRADLCIS